VSQRLRHVQLFGYYGGDAYLAELSQNVNLTWGGPDALARARAAGKKAVVDVQDVFAIASAGAPGPDAIAAAWSKAADGLRPDLDALAAVYTSDEPYWNASKNGVAFDEVAARLEAAATLIHGTPGFENVPVALIFSDPELDWLASGQVWNPAGYDWVGWDLYAVPIEHAADRGELFLSHVRPEQRVIEVPDAFLWSWDEDLAALETRVDFWLAWAEQHHQVVAIAPFVYQSVPAGTEAGITGARDLPTVKARYAEIGGCVMQAAAGP
jgi:hypothetical protein